MSDVAIHSKVAPGVILQDKSKVHIVLHVLFDRFGASAHSSLALLPLGSDL